MGRVVVIWYAPKCLWPPLPPAQPPRLDSPTQQCTIVYIPAVQCEGGTMSTFASLHNHSWYSLLEGVDSPGALAARAAVAGCQALALTDSNNLYGAHEHARACRASGIKPIFGARLRQPVTKRRATVLIAEPAG